MKSFIRIQYKYFVVGWDLQQMHVYYRLRYLFNHFHKQFMGNMRLISIWISIFSSMNISINIHTSSIQFQKKSVKNVNCFDITRESEITMYFLNLFPMDNWYDNCSDPNLLLTVCQEQGLSPTQCKLFANAFQLIDRYPSNFFFFFKDFILRRLFVAVILM